jgi:hypothetical protein
MESNTIGTRDNVKPPQTKFEAIITAAWKEARTIYLKESGLKEDSEEWKFINETKQFSQITEVVNETWAHYNNPVACASSGHASRFATSSPHRVEKPGVRARLKRRFKKALDIKESGEIFQQSQSDATSVDSSYIDEPSRLEQKLSGKPFKGRDATEMGLQLTAQVQAIEGSEKIKTVVSCVLGLTDSLQPLVSASDLVSSLKIQR